MFIVALPIILLNSENQSTFTIFGFLGLLIWIIGFFFESVGDYQLEVFKSNPENKEKIMDKGLWKYSRHPIFYYLYPESQCLKKALQIDQDIKNIKKLHLFFFHGFLKNQSKKLTYTTIKTYRRNITNEKNTSFFDKRF